MVYELRELGPLEKRLITNEGHMLDNRYPERTSQLLQGRSNTFLVQGEEDYCWVSVPFEGKLDEPLEGVVEFLMGKFNFINLLWQPESITNQDGIAWRREIRETLVGCRSALIEYAGRLSQNRTLAEDLASVLKKR